MMIKLRHNEVIYESDLTENIIFNLKYTLMKLIGTLFLSMVCACIAGSAYAENYFNAGTLWEYVIFDAVDPENEPATCTYKLDKTDGSDQFTLLRGYPDADMEPESVALIRTDGDKVWFSPVQENPEWFLMYDFGINPEEKITVTYAGQVGLSWFTPKEYTLKCLKTEAASGALNILTMGDVDAWGNVETDATGRWLSGFGSMTGLLDNCRYNIEGNTTVLKQVSVNGKVLYTNSAVASVSGIELKSRAIIRATDRGVELSGLKPGETIALYNAAGMKTAEVSADSEGKAVIPASKGIILIKTSTASFKTIL